MYHNFRVLLACLFFSFPIAVQAQGTGNSPFSQFGIGDLGNTNGNVRNMGMGYTGVSARHHYFINLSNPALLPNLRTAKKPRPNHTYKYWDYYRNQTIDSTVKLDFALTYQQRSIQADKGYESSGGINISYFAFALPLSKTWSTAIGIQPYATVNYNLTSSAPVINDPATTADNTNSGKGGIYKIFWSHGVGITKNLSLGLESAFLYGNVNTIDLSNIAAFSTRSYGFKRQTSYSAMAFKPGILFRKEIIKAYYDTIPVIDSNGISKGYTLLRKTKSTGMFYNIGLTSDLNTSLNINQDLHYYVMDNSNRISSDTSIGKSSYKAKLPPAFRLGVSLDVPLKWTIAADVFYSAWSVYKPNFLPGNDTMSDSYGFSIGGEFSPGPLKLKSKTYRVGFSYMKTPVTYRGKQLDDVSVSIGATIAFGKRSATAPVIPRLNVAVIAGQRGNIQQFSLREQYVKVQFGILINEKWFNKRKIY